MPHTANQETAWNISDCLIILNERYFSKNCITIVDLLFSCMKNIFHFKMPLKNENREKSLGNIIYKQLLFKKGKPNILKNNKRFLQKRKIILLL